ncbi:MAG: TonB-dependent receptor [Verrucomicrobiota bacterium]
MRPPLALVVAFGFVPPESDAQTSASSNEADVFVTLETEVSSDDEPLEGELDLLVIDADKLERNLFENSTSVGRVDGKRLEDSDIRTLNDAYRLLGNVRGPQFVDGGFVIRGINSESPDAENISADQAPLSTIYVDGVALTQQAARRGPSRSWDVASIEVLRGPQTTLQGRNALAGSVNITTRDPELEIWQGAIRQTFGNYATNETAAMLNVPLGTDFALRFTFEHAERESFVDYPLMVTQPNYDDFRMNDFIQFRAKALYDPTHLPFSSKLTYSHSRSNPTANDVFGPNAPRPVPSFFDRLWLIGGTQQTREADADLVSWDNRYDLNDHTRLTSLTTFLRTKLDVDQVNAASVREDTETEWTQEFRSNWEHHWGKAVLGLYGSFSDFESTQLNIKRERNNYALFGEIDYAIDDHWHVIGGGRLFHETYDFSSSQTITSDVSSTDTEFLPKIGLRYDFNPYHTLGFNFQRGYQSGGSGFDVNTPYNFDPSYTNHYELSWRKDFLEGRLSIAANAFYSDWTDQQVVARTFDPTTGNASERVVNASESTLQGAEIEIEHQANECLTFFGSIGLLSTRYDDFKIDVTDVFGNTSTLNYDGYDFPESPSFNGSLGFSWRPGNGFYLNGDLAFSSSYYSPALFANGPFGAPLQIPQNNLVKVDSFITANLSAGYQLDQWTFSVFVNNLFDEDYLVGKTPSIAPGGGGVVLVDQSFATVGAPRYFGGSVEYRF